MQGNCDKVDAAAVPCGTVRRLLPDWEGTSAPVPSTTAGDCGNTTYAEGGGTLASAPATGSVVSRCSGNVGILLALIRLIMPKRNDTAPKAAKYIEIASPQAMNTVPMLKKNNAESR